jgi:hypothetical protein
MVLKETRRLASSSGIEASEIDVAGALQSAIADGFVSAYRLSALPPHSTKVEYSADQLYALWYYVTQRGRGAAKGIPELSGES